MTAPVVEVPPVATAAPRPPKSPGYWGMVFLCVTEGMLFASFLASFLYLHGSVAAFGAGGGKYPELRYPLVMTVVLLSSSVSMEWGFRGIKAGDTVRLRAGLMVTFLLGALFLGIQVREYASRDLSSTVSAYESVAVTTTTFHGMHVALGLLMNAFVQVLAWRGWFSRTRHEMVENVAFYWHFVDAVWIAILTVIYLSPRLW